jgi:hypothetical protein
VFRSEDKASSLQPCELFRGAVERHLFFVLRPHGAITSRQLVALLICLRSVKGTRRQVRLDPRDSRLLHGRRFLSANPLAPV